MRIHTLQNANGIEVRVAERGGVILSLRVPDRHGRLDDVVLGYDSVEDYHHDTSYFGAIIGRYANRIAYGRFTLDGTTYRLPTNEPPHHLHGGPAGFHAAVWDAEPVADPRGQALELRYTSPDGEGGYPGTLETCVRYALTDGDDLVMEYDATADRPTPVNLTHHSYFNLGGEADVLSHVATVDAEAFTPVDGTLIPTGEIRAVEGTPFDFRTPVTLGARIDADDDQLRIGGGYDHNYVLSGGSEGPLRRAARLEEPRSGRVLEVHTTEPGLQLYTGNHLAGVAGKGGVYRRYAGVALETQHFPDSPNRPEFPSTIVGPGRPRRSRTVYRFRHHD